MENNLIMFNSVTSAMKCREVLRKNKISCEVIRTPTHLRRKSCGHSVFIKKDFGRAMEVVKRQNIKFLGVASVDKT